MKKINKLTDKELEKKLDKIDNKINNCKNLIWMAVIMGVILLFTTLVGAITGLSWLAKSCGIVAGLQSVNICLFLGIGLILTKKESKLVIEQHYRDQEKTLQEEIAKIQEELKEKVQEIKLEFEQDKTNHKEEDNNKTNHYDDEFKID